MFSCVMTRKFQLHLPPTFINIECYMQSHVNNLNMKFDILHPQLPEFESNVFLYNLTVSPQ